MTADNQIRPQATPNPPLTVTYSGFQGGDTSASLGGTLAVTTPATILSPIGAYPITPSGLTSGNYAIVFVNGVLTVTAGTVTPPLLSIPAAVGAVASAANPPGAPQAAVTVPVRADSIDVLTLSEGAATVGQISETISIVGCGASSPAGGCGPR
ncbi:MAG: hypothetical protein JOZ85_08950 [Betaproteobacteria bacterium]|nr:hypothetical protein [Betaproteobacteria bacterium]